METFIEKYFHANKKYYLVLFQKTSNELKLSSGNSLVVESLNWKSPKEVGFLCSLPIVFLRERKISIQNRICVIFEIQKIKLQE